MPDEAATAPTPALHGTLRTEPADFRVDELPQYAPCGSGEHLYLHIEKTGLTTHASLERIARALGVPPRDIGYAGLKDRHAVTTQWISVPRVEAEQALALELPGIRILEAVRHGNKLRTGHLAGNRFDILVRGADVALVPSVQAALNRLMLQGLPNLHGPQRYGVRGDNAQIGGAIVRGEVDRFVSLISTAMPQLESPRVVEARAALAAREAGRALDILPREFVLERHCASAWLRGLSDAVMLRSLPHQAALFLINAWQSALFDNVLRARLALGPALRLGDVAMKTTNGASFVVQDTEACVPRQVAFEIVPTGPLPGSNLLRPEGAARELEDAALLAAGCDPATLESLPLPGARRALLVRVQGAVAAADPCGVRLQFSLPAGAFATTLLAVFDVHETRGASA